jgi:tetratricopeptide (TPR) repeat protein
MRRKLNPRFFLGLLVVVGLLAVGTRFLHGYQVKHHADTFLQQANREEEAGHLPETVSYLYRYLAYKPGETAVRARYGLLLDQLAATPQARWRALSVLEAVIGRDPNRADVRRRLVRSAMELAPREPRLFAVATSHLNELRKAAPNDGELDLLLGICQEATNNPRTAEESYRRATQHDPKPIAAFAHLARMLRAASNPTKPAENIKQADALMNEVVQVHAKDPQAWLTRARYHQTYHTLDEALADVAKARDLAPEDTVVLLAAGDLARRKGDVDKARASFEKGLKHHPKEPALYLALADLELQAERRQEALVCLRRGLEEVPNNAGIKLQLANVLIAEGQADAASKVLGQLREARFPPEILDYFEARLLCSQNRWLEGTRRLEKVRGVLVSWPEYARQADLLLGQCYEHFGDGDRQELVYRRALAAAPLEPIPHQRLAAALLAQGRVEEALVECRQLVALKDPTAAAWILYARVLFQRNFQAASARQDWSEVERALDRAAKADPQALEVPLLRAEVLAAQKEKLPQAQALVEKLRDQHPKQLRVWAELVSLAERQGEAAKPLQLLDQAQRQFGDTTDVRLLRARYWGKRQGPEAHKALTQLAAGLEKFTPAEQLRLLGGLAEAHGGIGDFAEADRLWNRLIEQQSDNLRARLQRFDAAVHAGKEEALPALVEGIKKVEGEEGTLWRYAEAVRILRLARRSEKGPSKEELREARRQLDEVARRRPTWSRVPLLQAAIAEVEESPTKALDFYRKALDLGEQQPYMVRRALQLMLKEGRATEANELVRKLQERSGLPGDLGRVAAEVALQNGDSQRGLELARLTMPAETKDHRDYLWLTRFLVAVDRRDEAEATFRRALGLADSDPTIWQMLVLYLASTGQKDKTEVTLREARAKLTPVQASLLTAQAHEFLGNAGQALREYSAALTAWPEDLAVQRQVANAYLRTNNWPKAEPLLRTILANPAASKSRATMAWARRGLALCLGQVGLYTRFQEALALIRQNRKEFGPTVEDTRAEASVLATHSGRRMDALKLLEGSRSQAPLQPEEQFLLASLYNLLHDWPRARELFQTLVAAHGNYPVYVGGFATALLDHGEREQAQIWVSRLEQLEPEQLRTVSLKAQLLHNQNRSAEAVASLRAFAAKNGPDSFAAVAAVLEGLGQQAAAEELLRKFSADPKHPERVLGLVGYLARRQRVPEALDLLDRAWRDVPATTVAVAALGVIAQVRLDEAQSGRVRQAIEIALQKAPTNTYLMNSLAVVLEMHQGRVAEAVTLYRKVLNAEPDNTMALNNLALLLALHEGKPAEALTLIELALKQMGPDPALLDTRGVVLLANNQPALAIKDCEDAVVAAATPYRCFHLAQARLAAGNVKAAQEALNRGKNMGLGPDLLHPLERSIYTDLVYKLTAK